MDEAIKAAWSRYWGAIFMNDTVLATEEFKRAQQLEGARRTTTKVEACRRTTQRLLAPIRP